jgi:hypothetical protein
MLVRNGFLPAALVYWNRILRPTTKLTNVLGMTRRGENIIRVSSTAPVQRLVGRWVILSISAPSSSPFYFAMNQGVSQGCTLSNCNSNAAYL